MKDLPASKSQRGQSLMEMAVALPFLLFLLIGMTEVAFAGRTYLALLEASVVGSRLGSSGETYYDDNDIFLLTTQVLSQEGYDSSGLIDIFVVRADLVGGETVENYQVTKMLGSERATKLTEALLLSRLDTGDPDVSVVGVEVLYDHNFSPNYSGVIPYPLVLRAYTIQIVP
jgi:hypothetical protein